MNQYLKLQDMYSDIINDEKSLSNLSTEVYNYILENCKVTDVTWECMVEQLRELDYLPDDKELTDSIVTVWLENVDKNKIYGYTELIKSLLDAFISSVELRNFEF